MVDKDQKRETHLQMTTITDLASIMQDLLTTSADQVAKKQDLSSGNAK